MGPPVLRIQLPEPDGHLFADNLEHTQRYLLDASEKPGSAIFADLN